VSELLFHGRKAFQLENDLLRVTVLLEGGHIAEVFDKRARVSPLWIPHWKSIEPSRFNPNKPAPFGPAPDGPLLAGIMGHNLCLDIFGGPTDDEAAAGLTAHGEGSVLAYSIVEAGNTLTMSLTLPLAQLDFTRVLTLDGETVRIHESIQNRSGVDRPIGWTQHVTLSPPFLNPATTQFRASMARSIVAETDPGKAMYLVPGCEFTWPNAPAANGSLSSLEQMHPTAPASGYTAHVADPAQPHTYFVAWEPRYKLAFGYIWKTADFPWMGIWEENCSRTASPWDSKTITRGMEFGVSPFPESRRAMVERSRLLGTPTFRWMPAYGRLETEYCILSSVAENIPSKLDWPI
jgi:hypothetical protein